MATLRRNFRQTVAYYTILERYSNWQIRHLRTTSRLGRFNRNPRRRFRAAAAFHSDDGISSVVSQEIALFNRPV